MPEPTAPDVSPDRAADEAGRAGLSGREVCVVLEGTRFVLPTGSGRCGLTPGATLEACSGIESDALVLRPAAGTWLTDPLPAIRTLSLLGVKQLLLLADAESMRPVSHLTDVVYDHVNLRAANPLAGANDDRFGPRFPDMSEAYDARPRRLVASALRRDRDGIVIAASDDSGVKEVVARHRVWSDLGVDAVTQGVVAAALVARHAGLLVAAAVAYAAVPSDSVLDAVRALLDGERGIR